MAVVLMLQMMPGAAGGALHEFAGIAFAILFVLHHRLNRGWLRRLGGRANVRAFALVTSDLIICALTALTIVSGLLMSRTATPFLSVPALAYVARPLHDACAYGTYLATAFHIGLHVRALCGYAGGRRVGTLSGTWQAWAILLASLMAGAWGFHALGIAGRLMGAPCFPDGVTPVTLQMARHVALAAPFMALGSRITNSRNPS